MGPIIEPRQRQAPQRASPPWATARVGRRARAPRRNRQLWSPGVRSGVKRGSYFHLTEYFGPVLGVMTAETLEEAIAIQNEVEYGLTAGLHSLDSAEMGVWLDTIQAGNLYVNRGITGAIVRRQPFGGWKKSAVGAGTKAGGPNYLFGLGSWLPAEAKAKRGTMLQGAAAQLLAAAKSADVTATSSTLQQSLFSDAAAWESEFGTRRTFPPDR